MRAVVDARVWELHGARILGLAEGRLAPEHVVTVPPGESSKSWEGLGRVVDFLLRSGVRRNTPVWAIGGGVTGDLAGAAAALVLRGLPLVHIPTTLLAMVDSSLGGKTGVNHAIGKNLIGAFHQPDAVVIDPTFLGTLPESEWRGGLGEVLKYGWIAEPSLLSRDYRFQADSPESAWADVIATCVRIKMRFVEADETEQGVRAHLNFGHTFGHALEAVTGYNRYLHGEAVFLGMRAALRLSHDLGYAVDPTGLDRFRPLFPADTSGLLGRVHELNAAMRRDKKAKTDQYRFVVITEPGVAAVVETADETLVQAAWEVILQP